MFTYIRTRRVWTAVGASRRTSCQTSDVVRGCGSRARRGGVGGKLCGFIWALELWAMVEWCLLQCHRGGVNGAGSWRRTGHQLACML